MPFTVFYSWQSDKPNSVCRGFIEECVKAALKDLGADAEVQSALRDEPLAFDKDTKGVPGMPPISQAIFDKITSCGIFVPDFTFVGRSDEGRMLSNPNVLIEHGWALAHVSHSRVVAVMNSAYGAPSPTTLPFDMRHMRSPITYELAEDAGTDTKRAVRRALIKELSGAFRLVIKHYDPPPPKEQEFVKEAEQTDDASTFLPMGTAVRASLWGDRQFVHLASTSRAFVRLIPSTCGVQIRNAKAALDLISGRLAPMVGDRCQGWTHGRNELGAAAFEVIESKVHSLTQLFPTGEIWGINSYGLDPAHLKEHTEKQFAYFPSVWLERLFARTLTNYLAFAETNLRCKAPFKVIAGVTNVHGYRMAYSNSFQGEGMIKNDFIWKGHVNALPTSAGSILRPFFDELWEECGLNRPDVAVPLGG